MGMNLFCLPRSIIRIATRVMMISASERATTFQITLPPKLSMTRLLPLEPVFPFIRIRDVAAYAWVIMGEHATHAESHIMMDAPDNCAPALAFLTRRMP